MDHAWLDSLSEDWVSQPRSSGSPAPSLPSLSNSTSDSSTSGAKSSRIPTFDPERKQWTAPQESNTSPLSERSLNDHNIPLSLRSVRQPSKLRDEITHDIRGRNLPRTVSASTVHSLQYSTVQHKSTSISPRKGNHETPEWRKRLLHGEVGYGEQCDLFSPAGLENLFRPPNQEGLPMTTTSRTLDVEDSSIIPSSPPPYNRVLISGQTMAGITDGDFGEAEKSSVRQRPRTIKYNMVDQEASEDSMIDASQIIETQKSSTVSRSSEFTSSEVIIGKTEETRAVSGQSDVRNEEFSPLYVARHNVEGKIDYAALNLPPHVLQEKLEKIRQEHPSSIGFEMNNGLEVSFANQSTAAVMDGRFVNLRRGGYSQEGSFQKRLLSPSSLPAFDESAMLPEESIQASTPKTLPNVWKIRTADDALSIDVAHDPPLHSQMPDTNPQRPISDKTSGGSPLKLFGNYDTFTNQKLLRRLSQFEGDYSKQGVNSRSSSRDITRSEENEGLVTAPTSQKDHHKSGARGNGPRKTTSFGQGDLDDFQFSEEVSYNSNDSNLEDDKDNISLPLLDSRPRSSFKFQLDPSPAFETRSTASRSGKKHTITRSTFNHIVSSGTVARPRTSSSPFSTPVSSTKVVENLQTPRKRDGDTEGKRLPKSPLKDPTPKRRRTLQKSEFARPIGKEVPNTEFLNDTHQQIQSVLGRKRKDARHDDDQQAANPKVLAMRQILRPRTPTPSQRIFSLQERPLSHGADIDLSENARDLQARKIAEIQAELDSNEPYRTSMPLGVGQQMQNDSRKGSVTTQDFLDEAKKIMAGIRGKARSGLASLEESESEHDRQISPENGTPELELENSYQESTREPFSRPPSREGKPLERLPKQQDDPALLDHLRKYQEVSDMDMVIASSVKSIAMAREATAIAKALDRLAEETISRSSERLTNQRDVLESDPPNIKISENPEVQRKRKYSTSSVISGSEDHLENDYPSHGSNVSSGQSTTRSIPTGSSRGSDSRRVIAPHSVSHLIPEQLAGMFLDRERNIWIKRKSVDIQDGAHNFLASDASEDDPFGDIPDLSVDETQEQHRLKAIAAKRKEALDSQPHDEEISHPSHSLGLAQTSSVADEYNDDVFLKAQESSMKVSTITETISRARTVQSNSEVTTRPQANHPISSQQSSPLDGAPGTRSNLTEFVDKLGGVLGDDDVEKEISILEDRVDLDSPERRRHVTISFSSPLAQVISSSGDEDNSLINRSIRGSIPGGGSQRNLGGGSVLLSKKSGTEKTTTAKIRSALRTTSRRMSLGGHTFSARPVSRIDEHEEDSFTKHEANQRRNSVSVVNTTPLPARREASIVIATPIPVDQIGNLSLTPLSDFTVHQADRSFGMDVSYIERGHRYALGKNAKRTLSLSIKELVEKITQVEPYEPFWEHMKHIDLKDKRLASLHKLDQFCEQLVELDASHNQITQLEGVPTSIRDLRITHNHLSDLAAWGHLKNLQYIDVSNNEIESLSGFRNLVHLRGLRADNNKIRSLNGISQLSGLLQLRLRGNAIESLNFTSTGLYRLTDLDLKSNNVSQILNLHELQALSSLNLEENDLSEFGNRNVLRALRYLKLSGNQLDKLDVSRYPDLRLLYLDRNRLESVQGLLKTKYLDSLSMREQQDGVYIDTSFLSQALEVRKLFLSGNLLTNFQLQVEYLNLQYLELANCGIETLSPEFGYMVPNARVVNLNFNALKDVRPLAGIVRLKKLHLAGNRLARLRTTTTLISEIETLSFVDLRNNPLTQGFYPPLSETRMVIRRSLEDESVSPPFTLGDASRGDDNKYVSRLDQHTKLLRRTFEMLVLSGCKHLKTLDGLAVDRSVLVSRDVVWKAMISAGLLKPDEDDVEDRDLTKRRACVQ